MGCTTFLSPSHQGMVHTTFGTDAIVSLPRASPRSLTSTSPQPRPCRPWLAPSRRTASKYLVVLEGGALPPAPCIGALTEGEYTMYEREMNNREVREGRRHAGRQLASGSCV